MDKELITLAQNGDKDAQQKLLTYYNPFLKSVINKFSAKYDKSNLYDDLMQDASVLFLELLQDFNPERSQFGYYLKRNFSTIFSQKHFRNYQEERVVFMPETCEIPDAFNKIELMHDVARHLATLDTKQKVAITLYYLMDLPQAKCAEYMDMQQSAFSRLLDRARKSLKKKLEM